MHNSKKAQISDTMSWLVATVIIVILLIIPIILIEFNLINKKMYFPRLNDVFATKSFSGYLLKEYLFLKEEILQGKLSSLNEEKLEYLLKSLPRHGQEGWNVAFLVDGKGVYNKVHYSVLSLNSKRFWVSFYFEEQGKKILLNFWMEGQGQ